ncbi:MAG: hypothetical protein J6K46_03670 [Sutterella sp.]|nr:hypothetical protein [Sutterella sp.]
MDDKFLHQNTRRTVSAGYFFPSKNTVFIHPFCLKAVVTFEDKEQIGKPALVSAGTRQFRNKPRKLRRYNLQTAFRTITTHLPDIWIPLLRSLQPN